jgi:hypothetical protein
MERRERSPRLRQIPAGGRIAVQAPTGSCQRLGIHRRDGDPSPCLGNQACGLAGYRHDHGTPHGAAVESFEGTNFRRAG